jgi:hypothetical protein
MLQLPPAVVSDVDDLEKKARLVQATWLTSKVG